MPGEISNFSKSLAFKSASVGVVLSSADLEAINSFALSDLTTDQIYSRKVLLAHNAVDRDRERFPEDVLKDFARTLPGKSFLWAHFRREYTPYGLWFKTETEEITPAKFTELTGEEPRLPDHVEKVVVLWAWFYVLKECSEQLVANVEAGVFRHFSIGFGAKDLTPVRGEFDQLLYWEYVGPGEALEGSLVWLGAQHGATSQKAYKDKYLKNNNDKTETDKEVKTIMKDFIKKLSATFGKTFSDSADVVVGEVKALFDAKDAEILSLTEKNAELSPLAEMGKTFQESLASDFSRLKGILGEREDTENADTAVKGYAKNMDIDFLQSEVKNLQKRVDEKFPNGPQLEGDDTDKRTNGNMKNALVPDEDNEK